MYNFFFSFPIISWELGTGMAASFYLTVHVQLKISFLPVCICYVEFTTAAHNALADVLNEDANFNNILYTHTQTQKEGDNFNLISSLNDKSKIITYIYLLHRL